MRMQTQQKLDTLASWNKHDLDAPQDTFKVSRSTLYRWHKAYPEVGLSPCMTAAAPHDASSGAVGHPRCGLKSAACIPFFRTSARTNCT